MNAVTRVEIAECVVQVFDGRAIHPARLIEVAQTAGARREVLDALDRLHENSYSSLRDLWPELADIPVEA